jgi:uncharacterized membrane-anchored protein
MFWLIYCGFFVLMVFSIFRMLRQRGQNAWLLFLGLIAWAAAYVGLFVLPVASSTVLDKHRVLLGLILVGGTLLYAGVTIYFIRRMAVKMKTDISPPP